MKAPRINVKGWLKAIKPALYRNKGLKLFSLVCAITLYAFVHGARDAQRMVSVDLVALLPPASENRTLTSDLPASVRVSLRGSRSLVGDLRASDLGNLQVDLRHGRSGKIPLRPEMLRVPGGVVVDSIEPSSIDIAWDDVIERTVQIQVSVTGVPADGAMLRGRATSEPSQVVARGARQAIEILQMARLEPFDINGLQEGTHQRTLAIERPPSRVAFDVANAVATVQIVRRHSERTFSKLQVQVVGLPKATVIPAQVDVRVTGTPTQVAELRVDQIIPKVTVSEEVAKTQKGTSVSLPVLVDLDNVQVTVVPKSVVLKW